MAGVDHYSVRCAGSAETGDLMACCNTSQRALRAYALSWATPEKAGASYEYLRFRVMDFKPNRVRHGLAFTLYEATHEGVIPTQFLLRRDGLEPSARAAAKRGAKEPAQEPELKLPFGIRLGMCPQREFSEFVHLDEDIGMNKEAGAPSSTPENGAAHGEASAPSSPHGPSHGGADDSDGDGNDVEDPEGEGGDHRPDDLLPGHRVGLVNFERSAATGRSSCYFCTSQGFPKNACLIAEGAAKFHLRLRRGQVEKSVHAACVVNGNCTPLMTESAKAQTGRFLVELLTNPGLDDVTRTLLNDALDAVTASASAGASSSGGAAGSRRVAAPAQREES